MCCPRIEKRDIVRNSAYPAAENADCKIYKMKKENILPEQWVFGTYSKALTGKYVNPLYVLIVTICSVFISEVLIMFILAVLPFSLGLYERAFLDGILLTFLMFPLFYLLLFRPMVLHISERKKAEQELLKANLNLEEQVEKRTAELKAANRSLRNLSAHLQSVREEERMNIARNVHDELGQTLTALKMELSWLARKLPADQGAISDKVQNMISHIDMTIDSVQRIYTELRPTVLDNLGLVAAIEWQAKEFQERTGIKCEVSFHPENIIMDRDERTAVFRIFQEAMTNIARHAEASAVTIDLEETSDRVILTVKDNGKGITEEQILDSRAFGIIGMKERAYFLGGEVKISGIVNKGTTVILNIPATH